MNTVKQQQNSKTKENNREYEGEYQAGDSVGYTPVDTAQRTHPNNTSPSNKDRDEKMEKQRNLETMNHQREYSTPSSITPPTTNCSTEQIDSWSMRKEENKELTKLSHILGIEVSEVFKDYVIIFDPGKEVFIEEVQLLKKNEHLIRQMIEKLTFTKTSLYEYLCEIDFKISTRTIKSVIEVLLKRGIMAVEHAETGLKPAEIYFFPKSAKSRGFMVNLLEFFQKKFKLFKSTIRARKARKLEKKKSPEEIELNSYNAIKANKQAAAKVKIEERRQSNLIKKLNSEKIALGKRLRNHSCGPKCVDRCFLRWKLEEIEKQLEGSD